MKRPSWATRRMYKGVTPVYYTSLIPPSGRACTPGTRNTGIILTYAPGAIVASPNGVSIKDGYGCGRGIHAFTTKQSVHDFCHGFRFIILTVYASKWHGHGHKVRARRVWVGHKVKKIQK